MKKLIFLIVVFPLTIISAQQVKVGIKAGVNYAILNGDYEVWFDVKPRTFPYVGAFAEIMISEKIFLQPEMIYSPQGIGYESEEFLWELIKVPVKGVSKLDYLNLPIMGKFYVAEGLSLQVGPQVGFLLSAEREIETPEIIIIEEVVISEITIIEEVVIPGMTIVNDIKRNYKNIDFGVNVGVGYELKQGLFFDARTYLGLLNANNNSVTSGLIEAQNVVLQFSVGYFF